MSTTVNRIPQYSLHRPSGQARVRIDGKDFYLGRYGTPDSLEKYHRLLAEHASGATQDVATAAGELTIMELCSVYWDHAQTYYQKGGRPTGQTSVVNSALRALRETYGRTRVVDFGPRCLAAVQSHLIERDNCRTYVNKLVGQIRRVFKWAVAHELAPVSVYQAIATVDGLKLGRTTARESEPIRPVCEDLVDATLAKLPPVVSDMVKLQRLLGCRPGELCQLRPCDVDREGDVWTFKPRTHKTQHHGRSRVIYIGPKAQMILRGYLDNRPVDAFCFSPRESQVERFQQMRAVRRTKVQPSQIDRRKRRPKRLLKDFYSATSFARAIQRAAEAAFPVEEKWSDAKKLQWRRDHHWHPNQLRHSVGTRVRKEFGLEAAQTILGHSRCDVTQIYAERDGELARGVAQRIG